MFPWISVLIIAVLLGSIWRLYTYIRRKGGHKAPKSLVVITADSQATIEWWVRSFMFWNWIRGNSCQCICIDLGSTDDTLFILDRLKRRFSCIEVKRFEPVDRERPAEQLIPERLFWRQPLILDLRQPENRRIRSLAQDLS